MLEQDGELPEPLSVGLSTRCPHGPAGQGWGQERSLGQDLGGGQPRQLLCLLCGDGDGVIRQRVSLLSVPVRRVSWLPLLVGELEI